MKWKKEAKLNQQAENTEGGFTQAESDNADKKRCGEIKEMDNERVQIKREDEQS